MGVPWRRTPAAAQPVAESGDALVARIADWLPELETPLAWEAVEAIPFPVNAIDERAHPDTATPAKAERAADLAG